MSVCFRPVGVERRRDSRLLLLRAFLVEVQRFFGGVEKGSELCLLQRKLDALPVEVQGHFCGGVMNTAVGEMLPFVGVFKATSFIVSTKTTQVNKNEFDRKVSGCQQLRCHLSLTDKIRDKKSRKSTESEWMSTKPRCHQSR
jgi:hypothetical protein